MIRRATILVLLLGLSLGSGCECMIGECACPLPGCDACDPCAAASPCQATTCSFDASCPCPATPCSESAPSGKSGREWAEDLRSDDRVTRDHAVNALARMGGSALPEVEVLLTDSRPVVRYSALQVLVRLRGDAWPSVHDVKHRLADQDPAVRAEAAYVIGLTGRHAAEAIPELISALNDSSPIVRHRAAIAFQKMDRQGEPGRKALERASTCDRDPRVREAARCALSKLDEAICRQPDVPR